jgi:hypothetical protein
MARRYIETNGRPRNQGCRRRRAGNGQAGVAAPLLRDRKFADSSVERAGFEPVWGFSCQVVFWFVGGSLFGARKSFFVPSPAIRFAERAEGVKGPKR